MKPLDVEQLDEYDLQVLSIMAEHGLFLQAVGPTEGEHAPWWCYTVGLTLYDNHPEIVTFLPPKTAKATLNELGLARVKKRRERLRPGLDVAVFRGLPAYFIECDSDDAEYPMSMANRFFGDLEQGVKVPALQLVWPDQHGHFPWEEEYELDPASQPLLGAPPQ